MRFFSYFLVTIMILTGIGSGCATGKGGPGPEAAMVEEEGTGSNDLEARLQKIIHREIEADLRSANEDKHEVIRRKPYYYKEYAEYPDGSSNPDITLYETESRAAPFRADVSYAKVRYATRLQRRHDSARNDDNFLRHTGRETQAFELRNGRWVRLGSTFVAEKTEQRVGTTWEPFVESTESFAPKEEEPGFFGRIFGR